jgi:hypothetical protein
MARTPKEPPGPGTTPERYPVTIPPPQQYTSGDYTYTVELVMGMQATLGKLTEAVDALKDKSKGHTDKLEQIGRDVHTAKVIVAGVGAIFLVVLAAAAKALFDHYTK